MTDPPDPWEMSQGSSGEQSRDGTAAGEGTADGDPPVNPPGGEDAPGEGDTEVHERGLRPSDANDTLVEEVRPAATTAFAYTYEADPLAEYWETPAAQVVLPDESGPPPRAGSAGIAAPDTAPPGSSAPPGSAGQGQSRTAPQWSNRRIFAVFGIALIVVAVTSLSFGLMWGRAGGGAQAGSAQAGGAGANDAGRATMAAQARNVDRLLSASTSARDGVVTAVVQTRQCKHIGRSIRDLRAAAGKREQLVTRLRQLDVGAIPRGQQAVASLRRAWNASARADRAFAAWAQVVGAPRGCSGGTPVTGPHYRRALRASAAASEAKARFVRLWNPIAASTGLPRRSEKEI